MKHVEFIEPQGFTLQMSRELFDKFRLSAPGCTLGQIAILSLQIDGVLYNIPLDAYPARATVDCATGVAHVDMQLRQRGIVSD